MQSVQSALTHLLTTSEPPGTFSRLSTKRGYISITKFTTVPSLWTSTLGDPREKFQDSVVAKGLFCPPAKTGTVTWERLVATFFH